MSLVIRGLFCTGSLLAVAPLTVQAHLVSTRFGDFYGGMLHPLSALEHALPWLAVGLLAGFQGARFGRWILLAFPVGLLLGLMYAWYLDNRFATHIEYKMSILKVRPTHLRPEQKKMRGRRERLIDFLRESVFGKEAVQLEL